MNMASNNLQPSICSAACWRRDACGERDPSNSTWLAKKFRVMLAIMRSDNLVLSTEVFLHLCTLPVVPPKVIPKMKCILQRWKQYFGDLLNVCSATLRTAHLPLWSQQEEQNKEGWCCWSWYYFSEIFIYKAEVSITQTTSIYKNKDRAYFWKIKRRKVPHGHQCQLSSGWTTADMMFIASSLLFFCG